MMPYSKIRAYAAWLGRKIINTILPHRCLATGEVVEAIGMVSPDAFRDITFIIDPICQICGVPMGDADKDNHICQSCIDQPPVFNTARSSALYDGAVKTMILKFKHGDHIHGVKTFAPWIMRSAEDILTAADYLIPVPLHPLRHMKRRYNQAGLLAYELSDRTGTPTLVEGLKRIRNTASQGHMSRADRQANIKGAFDITKQAAQKIAGKHVVLIDDVLTSGATANECTKILLEKGASTVHIVTIARVI